MIDFSSRFFYHIYPLGFCGAPRLRSDWQGEGTALKAIALHAPRLAALGVDALYIGPLFESSSHGYDTVDYSQVDRRLGTNEDLCALVEAFHAQDIAVVLDAVFNHSSRDFFAFADVRAHKAASPYKDWYAGVDFSRDNEYGDGFSYEGWAGHTSLAKFDGRCAALREHLIGTALAWIDEFNIDGLRLDAANVMSLEFMRALSQGCKARKAGFWLLGEAVGEDYRALAGGGGLDSVTNYELYKSLWSSFNNKNFFELSWTLSREFGADGLYRGIDLYNFADNHDVNRAASTLRDEAHLWPLYGLLFCAPGIPSLYYGSEYGVTGERDGFSDAALRPEWRNGWLQNKNAAALSRAIAGFARIRRQSPALRRGVYRELLVRHEQFAFLRETEAETVIVAVNAAPQTQTIELPRPPRAVRWRDALCNECFDSSAETLTLPLYPSWLRILKAE